MFLIVCSQIRMENRVFKELHSSFHEYTAYFNMAKMRRQVKSV